MKAVDSKNYKKASLLMDSSIKNSGREKEIRLKLNESFYRSNLHSFLWGAGVRATTEIHSSHGRSDLAIEHMGKAYVIEMKAVEKAVSAETAAKNAMRQIIDRGYADSYVNPPILMSLAVAQDTRNIAACVFVKDGRADKLEFPVPLKKALKRQVDDKFDIKDVNSLSAVTQEKRMARAPRP